MPTVGAATTSTTSTTSVTEKRTLIVDTSFAITREEYYELDAQLPTRQVGDVLYPFYKPRGSAVDALLWGAGR